MNTQTPQHSHFTELSAVAEAWRVLGPALLRFCMATALCHWARALPQQPATTARCSAMCSNRGRLASCICCLALRWGVLQGPDARDVGTFAWESVLTAPGVAQVSSNSVVHSCTMRHLGSAT